MTCRREDVGTETRELHPNLVYAMAHMKPIKRIPAPVSVIDCEDRRDSIDYQTAQDLDRLTAYEIKRWNLYASEANKPGISEEEREDIHEKASAWHIQFQNFKRRIAGMYPTSMKSYDLTQEKTA